jgi:hypothetical protein
MCDVSKPCPEISGSGHKGSHFPYQAVFMREIAFEEMGMVSLCIAGDAHCNPQVSVAPTNTNHGWIDAPVVQRAILHFPAVPGHRPVSILMFLLRIRCTMQSPGRTWLHIADAYCRVGVRCITPCRQMEPFSRISEGSGSKWWP